MIKHDKTPSQGGYYWMSREDVVTFSVSHVTGGIPKAPALHSLQLSEAPEAWDVPAAQGTQMWVSPFQSVIFSECVPGAQAFKKAQGHDFCKSQVVAIVADLPAPRNRQKKGEVGGGHWIGATCTTKILMNTSRIQKVWTLPPCYHMSHVILANLCWNFLTKIAEQKKNPAWQLILLETFRSSVNCFKTAS